MELREWQYMNKPAGSAVNNSSSSGYKKRFEKLIKYHIDHASSELESVNKKIIGSWYFQLDEHYNTGTHEFDRIILVTWSDHLKAFILVIKVDGKNVYRNDYQSYEELLEVLTDTYMFLPEAGTQEYDDLLTESLNEWKYMNPPASSSQPASNGTKNYPSQEYRYKRLLAQIDSDGFCKYTINLLDDRILAITLNNGVEVKIIFKPYVPCYLVQVDGSDSAWKDYEDVLKLLIIEGIIGNTDLCESTSSIADDFKLYENLWG